MRIIVIRILTKIAMKLDSREISSTTTKPTLILAKRLIHPRGFVMVYNPIPRT